MPATTDVSSEFCVRFNAMLTASPEGGRLKLSEVGGAISVNRRDPRSNRSEVVALVSGAQARKLGVAGGSIDRIQTIARSASESYVLEFLRSVPSPDDDPRNAVGFFLLRDASSTESA